MMRWHDLTVSPCRTCHHDGKSGQPAYSERFDEVIEFQSPGLAPVRRSNEAWHIGPEGQAAYARRFIRTFGFYEGLAAVQSLDGWHHIRPDGSDLYTTRHAWCGNYQAGRCTVRLPDGRYRHIRGDGSFAYLASWRYAGDFSEGYCAVQDDAGHYTHLDPAGELLHGNWFVDLDVFHKGFARARDGEGWMHVDRHGKPIYSRRFAAVEPFYNGQARVERLDGGLEVVDEHGQRILELRPARQSEFAALSADMVGFWRTETIAAAVRLGVIEALPCPSDAVAERCGLSGDGALRLLRALAELRIAQPDEESWELTPRGEFLRASHPLTLADAALEYAGPLGNCWALLPQALLRETEWRAPDVFTQVANDPLRVRAHHRMLQSYARHDYAQIPDALNLQGNESILDAGGGFGTLAMGILEAYPGVRVTVLDKPPVVNHAQSCFPPRQGLNWMPGDLFQPWGVETNVVILARVLHDWDDHHAGRILSHARAALPPGGRLFIIEMLLPPNGVSGALCDLHLLMSTGGRERSQKAFEALLEPAGFRLVEVRRVTALPAILHARAV